MAEEGAYASQLHFAVKENDVDRVRSLLQEGSSATVTIRDAVGRTALHWALVFGNDEAAKVLIINTPRKALDARDQQGCTSLHYAAARAYATMARVLIERGAFINAVDCERRTPLHYAAQQTSPDMVELLVSRGADRGLANAHGELAVDVADKWGSLSSIPCLTPDSVKSMTTMTTTAACYKQAEEGKQNDNVAGNAVPAEKPSSREGLSLEKLLRAWKASETEARMKKEAEYAAAHRANATLQAALRAWREAEHASRSRRALEEERPDTPDDACYVKTSRGYDANRQAGGDSDKGPTSMSGPKFAGFKGLTVETGEDEDESSLTSCTQQRRDLSWCTEWVAQASVAEVVRCLSPRERKLSPSARKVDSHAWVQVPTYKQTLHLSFGNASVVHRRSNSFDGMSHFIVQVGGLATKLPFMSSLEVY